MAYDSVYMGVDAGTTKLKLMLYDNSLREIGSASRDTVIYMPENGASEIDMDELWQSLCDAAQVDRIRFYFEGDMPGNLSGSIYWGGEFLRNPGLIR